MCVGLATRKKNQIFTRYTTCNSRLQCFFALAIAVAFSFVYQCICMTVRMCWCSLQLALSRLMHNNLNSSLTLAFNCNLQNGCVAVLIYVSCVAFDYAILVAVFFSLFFHFKRFYIIDTI